MSQFRGRHYATSTQAFDVARQRYVALLKQRAIFWQQRTKLPWLGEGDSNTRFFHTMATARLKRNWVHRLKDDNEI